MVLDQIFLANTLLFLLVASLQTGVFGDLLGEDDEDNEPVEDFDPSPLFDASQYSQVIEGTSGDDQFLSIDGQTAQAYFLGAGNDMLDATPGADYVEGGTGDDTITTLDGDDIVLGQDGNDRVFSGRGDDRIFGNDGDDLLEGSIGADTLSGGAGNDQLSGGLDNDILDGGAGDDILAGDRFDQVGRATRGVDIVSGGEGDDTLWLVGNDSGTGGEGEDLFRVFDSSDPDAVVKITDFDASDDRIEVIYDPEDAAPTLSVRDVPDTQDALISLDGIDIAAVTGGAGLSADDISLTTNVPIPSDVFA